MSAGRRQHWPALDGLRAVAIALVVTYHLGHLGGGWIGVDVFFVLSGFLITTLLLEERQGSGRISLRAFWARRARRLLPAVLLLLCALGVYAWAGGPGVVPAQLRAPALATLFYGANWQQIAAAHSYFAAFSAPSPLVHTWSLAIEEQYYVAWPLIVTGVGALGVRRRRGRSVANTRLGGLVAVTAALLVASVVWMGVCAHVFSVNRAYLGTDTRAWELLLGGLAAMVTSTRPATHGRRWSVAALAGVAVLTTVVVLAGTGAGALTPQAWIWDGGLFAAAAGAVVVLVSVVKAPESALGRLLSLPPVRWLGRVSYSLYLWHYPVIVLFTPADSGLGGVELLVARLGLMMGCTCFSYYVVEQPLRRADWHQWRRRSLVPLGVGATAAIVLAGTVTPAAAGTGEVTAIASSARSALVAQPGFRLTAEERPSTSHPLRVWIMGDSVMRDSSLGIIAALEATGDATVVENSSYGGWGLATDTGWRQQWEQIIAQDRPQLVIGTWSWDDQVAEKHPASYEALLHRALATLLAPGDGVEGVLLVQFPQAGPSPYLATAAATRAAWIKQTAAQDAWNRIARLVSGQFGGRAAYLTTAQLFAPDGRFLVWMRTPGGRWVRARKLDNAHMCPYGAALFGELVADALQVPLGLGDLRPGWENGAWTRDPRYNDPPGACPDDQPPPHYDGLAVPAVRGGGGAGTSKRR